MFCPHCGSANDGTSRFCPSCGKSLAGAEPAGSTLKSEAAVSQTGGTNPAPSRASGTSGAAGIPGRIPVVTRKAAPASKSRLPAFILAGVIIAIVLVVQVMIADPDTVSESSEMLKQAKAGRVFDYEDTTIGAALDAYLGDATWRVSKTTDQEWKLVCSGELAWTPTNETCHVDIEFIFYPWDASIRFVDMAFEGSESVKMLLSMAEVFGDEEEAGWKEILLDTMLSEGPKIPFGA